MQLRIGRGKRRHWVLPLAVDAQSTSAGGEDRETRGRGQQFGYPWRGVAHLLEVVQDQERAALAKMVDQRGHGREPAAIRQAQLLRDGPRHQLRVLQQRERDEEDAVRESLRLASPYLQREARLSGPPWSGQREQAGAAQQLLHFAELALTAEEAGELDRQIVGRGVEGLERGELDWQALDHELVDALGSRQILEAPLAKIACRDALWQVRLGQRPRGLAEQDLPAMPGRRDPRRAMDVEPHVVGTRQAGFTG